MIFYTANLMFGNETIAKHRHFKDASYMNNKIIENWNSVVTPEDKVYILGGIGTFEFLLSLNGEKTLMVTKHEKEFYDKYISSVTTNEEDAYNKEMFEVYVKNMFFVEKVLFQKSIVIKDFTGNMLRLSTDIDTTRNSDNFVIAGNMGDYQRMFNTGINADIYVNGLFPISEVDIRDSINHLHNLI